MARPARAASARIRRSRCPPGRGKCPSAATRSGTVRWSTQGGDPASIRVRRLRGRVPRQPAGHGGHQWLRQRLHPRHRDPHRGRLRQRGHPLHRGLMGQQHHPWLRRRAHRARNRGAGSAARSSSSAPPPAAADPAGRPPRTLGESLPLSRHRLVPARPKVAAPRYLRHRRQRRRHRGRCRRRGPTRRSSRAERTPVGADTASAGRLVTPSPRPRADPTSAREVDGRRPWRPVLLR